ncbi:MAG: hypothetical protein WEB00_11875 [Dehalococcoidia bacterium]
MPFAVSLAVLHVACAGDSGDAGNSEDTESGWGPLAVIESVGEGPNDARGGEGRLTITGECVTLELNGLDRAITLVWPDEQVSWDAIEEEIAFREPPSDEVRKFVDGDQIVVGGSGYTGGIPYLAKPDESCPGERFIVDSIITL